ncbi:hypothetical protein CPB85DRAFT_535483 [Mucidula mucida]|nr:hypothetical protein CPB85DRAFT_535483 [Mucidula mucida]
MFDKHFGITWLEKRTNLLVPNSWTVELRTYGCGVIESVRKSTLLPAIWTYTSRFDRFVVINNMRASWRACCLKLPSVSSTRWLFVGSNCHSVSCCTSSQDRIIASSYTVLQVPDQLHCYAAPPGRVLMDTSEREPNNVGVPFYNAGFFSNASSYRICSSCQGLNLYDEVSLTPS